MIEPSMRKYPPANEGPDIVVDMPLSGMRPMAAFWLLYGVLFLFAFGSVGLAESRAGDGGPWFVFLFPAVLGVVFASLGLVGLLGRQRVRVGSGDISIATRVAGLTLSSRAYPLSAVSDLRYSPDVYGGRLKGYNMGMGFMGSRRIGFEHDGKTVRFGAALDEPEARALIRDIKKRFPIPGVPE